MAAERINIERFLELSFDHPVIDVRSPKEFVHAHIPGAQSMPLFTDDERKIVGTTYKQQSREAAIKIGLDFFGPKMKGMVEQAENLLVQSSTDKKILLVYCWRGGMRSAAISWLLDLYGFKVYTLNGGYKKFRHFVIDSFTLPFKFNIIGGYTGSGKTELLHKLKEQHCVLDLEGIAKHKGSAFGNLDLLPQPSQEMFENLLALQLRSHCGLMGEKINNAIWLEDESQRIGQVNIPGEIWKNMRKSPVYFFDIPFEERLNHLVEEYGVTEKQRLLDAITRIREKLGGLNAKMAAEFLENGNILESFRILLKYYDKFYFKGLHNREALNSLLHTIECKTVTPENAARLIAEPQYQHEKP